MKPNQKSSRRTPAGVVHDHGQPESWLTVRSPSLTYINMRTLALLMFVSFAVLSTTHGNDGATKPQVTTNTETQIIAARQHEVAQTATRSTNYMTPASLIMWQLLRNIVNCLAQALNSPVLIEYGMEQGVDTSASLATVCPDRAH